MQSASQNPARAVRARPIPAGDSRSPLPRSRKNLRARCPPRCPPNGTQRIRTWKPSPPAPLGVPRADLTASSVAKIGRSSPKAMEFDYTGSRAAWYGRCQRNGGRRDQHEPPRKGDRMTARNPLPTRCDEAQTPVLGSDWLVADDGQDLAEYALLVALIALAVVGAVTLFGGQLVAAYNAIAATLPFG